MLLPKDRQIVLNDISMQFGEQEVLSNLSVEIVRGDFALIVGPNGGGKTTLLRIILGLLVPSRGEVLFFRQGCRVPQLDVGYLPQKSRIDSHFPVTVSEVVAMGLTGKKLSRIERRFCLDKILQQVGLGKYAATPIGELSGGQLQRALFARALITRPEVLVLDEPTSYVDKHFETMMLDLLHEANRTATVLLVSHENDCFAPMATRIFKVHQHLEEILL